MPNYGWLTGFHFGILGVEQVFSWLPPVQRANENAEGAFDSCERE